MLCVDSAAGNFGLTRPRHADKFSRMKLRPFAALVLIASMADAQSGKPRARDLGVPFEGTPGPLNAITDVEGVEVGHTTLISGDSVDRKSVV